MNRKKSLLNISTDIGGKIITLLIGIILPKLYIDSFGSEINGLMSSIANILVYLQLLEAGVGGASTQALYKAIGQDNQNDINGILAATDQFYKRTGGYFLAIVCVLAFLYPICVRSNINYITVCLLIMFSAVPSAIKYFFQGKYTILLNADNRAYVLNTFTLVFNTVTNLSKVALILLGYNIIIIQITYACISVLYMFCIVLYVKRKYSNLDLSTSPNRQAISKRRYVMVHTISSTIFSNIDILILSLFLNLKIVSVYTVYNMVFIQLNQILKGMSNGMNASLGQLYFVNKGQFKHEYCIFSVVYRLAVLTLLTITGVMILPFLRIYALSFKDINYIDYLLPVLFLSTNILDAIRWPEVLVINTTGYFQETQRAAILETVINIICSMILVIYFGIYGVLFGTIVALLYRTIDMVSFVNSHIVAEKYIKEIIYIFLSWTISVGVTISSYGIIEMHKSYISLVVLGIKVSIAVGAMHFIVSLIFYSEVYYKLMKFIKGVLKKRKKGDM